MMRLLKNTARTLIDTAARLSQHMQELKLERNRGYCVICEQETEFIVYQAWLRDHYKCKRCKTIPRHRALVNALNRFCPDWRALQVHESSPGGAISDFFKRYCQGYSSSHYYPDVPRGAFKGAHRSEDLTDMTFADHTFDVFITSDVFEHVFEPDRAFAEIARVLKPGGMHVFTMPWFPRYKKSVPRARRLPDGTIQYLKEAEYHGNPIVAEGSLVTIDWGLDFTEFIFRHSSMETTIYLEIDRAKGLDAQFLEVFISRKADGDS